MAGIFFSPAILAAPLPRGWGDECGAICARGGGGGMAAVDYHQPCFREMAALAVLQP